MNPPDEHPAGDRPSALVAALLDLVPLPLVVIAAGVPTAANAAALALFDCFDTAELAQRWTSLAASSHDEDEGTLRWDDGGRPRGARFERHAVDPATSVVLLAEEGARSPRDGLMLLANDAVAARPVVGALVHDVRGHANGVTLALAAVSAVLQHGGGAASREATALLADQVAVAQRECTALVRGTARWAALLRPPAEGAVDVDLAELVGALPTLLLHPSVEREVAVSARVDGGPMRVEGDPSRLHAALHGLALHLIERAARGAAFVASATVGDDVHVVELAVDRLADANEPLETGPAVLRDEDRSSVSRYAALRIVESHGGRVEAFDGDRAGYRVALPARHDTPAH